MFMVMEEPLVIIGAMFKITALAWCTIMLIGGLGVEAMIFVLVCSRTFT